MTKGARWRTVGAGRLAGLRGCALRHWVPQPRGARRRMEASKPGVMFRK